MRLLRTGWKPSLDLTKTAKCTDSPKQSSHNTTYNNNTTDGEFRTNHNSLNSSINGGMKSTLSLNHSKFHLNKRSEDNLIMEKVANAFNQISDLNDRQQIRNAIALLDNKEQRTMLIDKILKRQQEKLDADEIMKMSKVQPLLSRFVKKLKKPTLALFQDAVTSPPPKSSNQNKTASVDNNSTNTKAVHFESPNENETPNENGDMMIMNVKQEASELENRAKFLSIFMGNKKKKDDPNNKGDQISTISSVAELLMGRTDSIGKMINLNKVSEDSVQLIRQGREMQRLKANELLKDGQKQNLASHFKSYSLKNRFDTSQSKKWTKDPNINTFSSSPNEEDFKSDPIKLKGYLHYQNILDAAKVVEKNVSHYMQKSDKGVSFLISPSSIKNPQTRAIENRVRLTHFSPSSDKFSDFQRKRSSSYVPFQSIRRQSYKLNVIVPSQTNFLQTANTNNQNTGSPKTPSSPQSQYNMTNQALTSRDYSNSINQCNNYNNISIPFVSNQFTTQATSIGSFTNNKEIWGKLLKDTTLTQSNSKTKLNNELSEQQKLIKIQQQSNQNANQVSQFNEKEKGKTSRELAPLKSRKNLKNSNSCSNSLSSNVQYDFESIFLNQRNKTGVEKKKHFAYNYDQFYLFNNNKDQIQDRSHSAHQLDINNADFDLNEAPPIDISQKVISKNTQHECINFNISNQKTVKTVDKWKLEGQIHHLGKKQETVKEEGRDDESLVSFTEIKLDKLYKKTILLQNNQRDLQEINDLDQARSSKFSNVDLAQLKNLHHLSQVKKEVFYATQSKLKHSRRHNLS